MCFGNPSKSLEIARERMTPEAWAKFERDFQDFCTVNGMPEIWARDERGSHQWAKWAFFCGRRV